MHLSLLCFSIRRMHGVHGLLLLQFASDARFSFEIPQGLIKVDRRAKEINS